MHWVEKIVLIIQRNYLIVTLIYYEKKRFDISSVIILGISVLHIYENAV